MQSLLPFEEAQRSLAKLLIEIQFLFEAGGLALQLVDLRLILVVHCGKGACQDVAEDGFWAQILFEGADKVAHEPLVRVERFVASGYLRALFARILRDVFAAYDRPRQQRIAAACDPRAMSLPLPGLRR